MSNICSFVYKHVIILMVIIMIYLDYSATTPTSKEVLDSFVEVSNKYFGNPNSLHKLGVEANKLIESATTQIMDILKLDRKDKEVIYTSGSSESNNLAIKGICEIYNNRGKHIITTDFEHSSVYSPLSYLSSLGYEVDIVKTDEFGRVDLEDLSNLLRDDTILVSIASVNSEIGIIEPIEEIKEIVKKYPKCFLHVDMTQSMSKLDISLKDIDLVSFSAHKFYGIKGVGCLIKNKKIKLNPQIHGGKSTTIYRSGTPATSLIASISKALRLACQNMNEKYKYVSELNKDLRKYFESFPNVKINSNEYCSPYILNISPLGIKPETFLHALEQHEIYISTQTACSSSSTLSKGVLSLTKDEERAKSSIRISLSPLTTKEEIKEFKKVFKEEYEKLSSLRR